MPIANYPFVDINDTGVPKAALPVLLTNPANGFSQFTWALIDTGADSTVIPGFIATALYHDITHKSVRKDVCFGISGSTVTYNHTFRLKVLGLNGKGDVLYNKIAIKMNKRKFAVIQELHQMVVGENDFLKRYKLTINYPRKIFSLQLP